MMDPVVIPADSPARMTRDVDLAELGWIRRFTAGPPRLTEVCELYESLGHEVLLDPLVDAELASECRGCSLALALFRVVYTRAGPSWQPPIQNRNGQPPGRTA